MSVSTNKVLLAHSHTFMDVSFVQELSRVAATGMFDPQIRMIYNLAAYRECSEQAYIILFFCNPS